MNIFFNSRINANQSLLNVLFGQQQKAASSQNTGCRGTRDTLTISASGKEKLTKSTSGRTHNTSIDSSIDLKSYIASAKKTNIGYTGTSNKDSWTIGAYQAFTKKSGDCFNYYAAAKAMLDVCGIQNVDIVKSDTSHSAHYWSLINLGDGWYHFDATPRKGGGNFFMLTDAELAAYSTKHKNSHIFDSSLYPERATVSVQDKINYAKGTINK